MSVPISVTKNSISAESASIRNAASRLSAFAPNHVAFSPIGIQVQSVATMLSWPWVSPHQAAIARIDARNDRAQAAGPMTEWTPANGISAWSPWPAAVAASGPWPALSGG